MQGSMQRNKDGSVIYERLIALTEEQLNDERMLMKAFNIDPDNWVITSSKFNFWSTESKEKRLNNYQVTIKVKPKMVKDITLEDMVKAVKEIKPIKAKPFKVERTGKTYNIFITDNHIGSAYFNEQLYIESIMEAKHDIERNKVERVIISFLGDILHVDNVTKTTDRGTQLEMPMTSYDMVRKANELVCFTIETLSVVKTDVYWVQGNHSRLAEFQLFMGIEQRFSNNDHIFFDVDETRQKAYTIYETFIGIMHGDMSKKNYTNWSQFMFASLWGQSTRWEQHSGHLHSKNVFTEGGLMHTIHSTQKATDVYERGLGYGNYRPVMEAYIYENGKGRKNAFYY